MDVALVRKRLNAAIDAARQRAQRRRERVAEAQRAYENFLAEIATPIARQLTGAMKAEGYAFTVFTPGNALRVTSDRARDDFIEVTLDTSGDRPEVMALIRRERGSRTVDRELPVKPGAYPEEISDEDFLAFLLDALEPWLER